jgi:uncharacterized membrane protein
MITVTLYVRDGCQACDQAHADLAALQDAVPHRLAIVNVDHDQRLLEKYGQLLPMVEIGPYHLKPPFSRQDLQVMMKAAADRIGQMERVDQEGYQERLEKGRSMSTSDRITVFISKHYLAVVNILLLIYVGLPFLAPVLMKAGQALPATVIYKVYSPMCHQLAFRSWFLFGEQPYYPRQLAGIPGVITYEQVANTKEVNLIDARNFDGNPVVGYKVALCERDVAIYGFMLLFGLAFAITGRRIRAIPWYIWVIIGMGPIALDGFSQLPSLASGLPTWLPMRESTPLLRTLTGGLFGWITAWYLFPILEETAVETRRLFQRKLAVINQTGNGTRTER